MRPRCHHILNAAIAVFVLSTPFFARPQMSQEREIQLRPAGERETPLELMGLQKPEIAGIRISGFLVGSFSYNSHIQMVPGVRRWRPRPGRS